MIPSPALADEFIELEIPLRDGRFYKLHDICAECNRKLRLNQRLEQIKDREFELTFAMRLALVAVNQADLIRTRIEPTRLLVSIPNAQDDRVRRQNRRRLERLLGITLDEWPASKGLHLPTDFDPARRTLLLIHGLEGDVNDLARFAEACQHWGIQVMLFDYPNDAPLAWSADKLAADLQQLNKMYPNLKFGIVAHSMGGLVARQALEISLKSSSGVHDVFFLGTPHHGSSLAPVQPVLELALPLVKGAGFGLGLEMLNDGLGEAGDDLRPESEFLQRLAGSRRVAGIRYHSAIGKKSFVTPQQRLLLEQQTQALLDKLGVPDSLKTLMVDFLRSDELQSGKGDGAVSIVSAHLEGVDDEKFFDSNHIELLCLPGNLPEENPVFRWTVERLGWAKATGAQNRR